MIASKRLALEMSQHETLITETTRCVAIMGAKRFGGGGGGGYLVLHKWLFGLVKKADECLIRAELA